MITLSDNWIVLKTLKKIKDVPGELMIKKTGEVFIDGEPYNEDNPKYDNMSIDVEFNSETDMGNETDKLLELYKKAKSGEKKVVTQIENENEKKQTDVKF